MSSAPKETAEEVESLVPVEHVDSLKETSSSQQQDDSQRQETTLSADPEGNRQPEEMASGKRTAGFVFLSPSRRRRLRAAADDGDSRLERRSRVVS